MGQINLPRKIYPRKAKPCYGYWIGHQDRRDYQIRKLHPVRQIHGISSVQLQALMIKNIAFIIISEAQLVTIIMFNSIVTRRKLRTQHDFQQQWYS